MRAKSPSSTGSGPDLDHLLNAAVAAWIRTFPVEERLDVFLATVPDALRGDVRRAVKAAFKAASDYLEAAANAGPVELAAFHPAMEEHLRRDFPWLGEHALVAFRSYTGWYAWHEGYLGSPG